MTPKYMNFNLPPDYEFRYTLDYLIRRKAVESGLPLLSISEALAGLLQCTTRMVMYYRKEEKSSTRAILSDERLEKLGHYFNVQPNQLITKKAIPMAEELVLTSKALVTD